ncbi:MAG: hypothetical protein ACTTKH_00125 [Treponema sp.]
MKKLAIFSVATILFLFVSCIQNNFGESQGDYGTVVFDLTGGNVRSINESTALPELSNSNMRIVVESNGKKIDEKDFKDKEERKYKKSFLVGSKIKFIVIVMTKGGKWKGIQEHTVVSGVNSLNVKLKKAVASVEPLKFKLTPQEGNYSAKFSLGFFDETPFFDEEVSSDEYNWLIPSFCRDQKGRIYVFYKGKDGGAEEKAFIRRYTSEGDEDDKFTYELGAAQKTNFIITSDQKTGAVFASYIDLGAHKTELFFVEEGKPATLGNSIAPAVPMGDVYAISVYDNIFSFVMKGSDYIEFYKYDAKNKSVSPMGKKEISANTLRMNVKGSDPSEPATSGEYVDSFMNDKNIYLMFRYTNGKYFASTGMILKCDYAVGEGGVVVSDFKKLLTKNEYIADEHNIINIEDEATELYGPQKFVGFNEDVLYIADDGVVQEYEAGTPQLSKNKNRLVNFSLKNESISIEKGKANLPETWMPEAKPIEKTKPTVFFSYEKTPSDTFAKIKLHDGSNFLTFEGDKQVLDIGNPNKDGLRYIIDSSGNFYVLHVDFTSPNALKKYSPHKSGNNVVYERDHGFPDNLADADDTNLVTNLYYDNVKKDLYYYIGSLNNLYKLKRRHWKKIERGNYTFKPEAMVIYDGRVWAYNDVNKKIENIGIKEDDKLEDNSVELALPTELKTELGGKKIWNLSMYDDVLYFLYSGGNDRNISTLAMQKDNLNNVKTEKSIFVLPQILEYVRPIGFDKENGVKFFIDEIKKDYDGRVFTNEDKYVSLNYTPTALSATPHNLPSNDITWYEQKPVWPGTKQIMLWRSINSNFSIPNTAKETKYFAVLEDAIKSGRLPTEISLEGNSYYNVYNKFCYDQFGNLYVLIQKAPRYYVVRFPLNDKGEYDFKILGEKIKDSTFDNWNAKFDVTSGSLNNNVDKFIMAVYADTPDSGTLYYRVFDPPNTIDIKSNNFTVKNFNQNTSYQWMSVPEKYNATASSAFERQFMAMAANKDGVFIAEKDLEYVQVSGNPNKYYKNYGIDVRKYPLYNKDNPTSSIPYESPQGTINLVSHGTLTNMFKNYNQPNAPTNPGLQDGHAQWDEYIQESISDMYAYDGALYMLSYKQVGGFSFDTPNNGEPKFNKAIVSGNLLKIGDTKFTGTSGTAKSIASSESLHSNPVAKFAPSHIIGVLPKKIVIASNGYHGYKLKGGTDDGKQQGDNYDKVYFINLGEVEKLEEAEINNAKFFNFQIKHYTEAELLGASPSTSAFIFE